MLCLVEPDPRLRSLIVPVAGEVPFVGVRPPTRLPTEPVITGTYEIDLEILRGKAEGQASAWQGGPWSFGC